MKSKNSKKQKKRVTKKLPENQTSLFDTQLPPGKVETFNETRINKEIEKKGQAIAKEASEFATKKALEEKQVESQEKQLAPFTAFDMEDENQIIAELSGSQVESYIYEFEQDGKLVKGLSWKAIRTIAQANKDIETDDVKIVEGREGYYCVCKATNLKTRVRLYGAAYQAYKRRVKDKEAFARGVKKYNFVDDEFAYVKAVSKAQRNAIRNIIPENLVSAFIKKFTSKKDAVKQITHTPESVTSTIEPALRVIFALQNQLKFNVNKFREWVHEEYKVKSLRQFSQQQTNSLIFKLKMYLQPQYAEELKKLSAKIDSYKGVSDEAQTREL